MSRVRWRLLPLPPVARWREVMALFGVGPEAALALWHRGVERPETWTHPWPPFP